MNDPGNVYSFVLRGLLTEEALDAAGRHSSRNIKIDEDALAKLVGLNALDEQRVAEARAMAVVYTAIAAFENSVRYLISKTLLGSVGANWWQSSVSEKIRNAATARMQDELKVRWHAQRGGDPIQYTMLPNLLNIIRQNFTVFEPAIQNIDWAANIFDAIERSRNVIMHSGTLTQRDIARVGSLINDWTRQVGA